MTGKQTLLAYFTVFAVILFSSFPVFGQQYKISGKVTDAVSREPIPFAYILLNGKNIGTTTDFEGKYVLHTSTIADSLVAQSIGYQTSKRRLLNVSEQVVNFVLQRSDISLKEVVIKPAEDPAVVLFRKIIKNKEKNSNRVLNNYSYEAYNKVELDLYDWNKKFQDRKVMRPFQFVFEKIDSISEDKPFLPVFLSEILSDYYYRTQPKEEERENIKASQQSGVKNESLSQFLGSMYQEVSVYDNWPALFYKNFVSPINDNGLNYYKYELVDSGYVEDAWCYKMTFVPKNQGSFTFVGDMWVAEDSWAIKQVSMEVAKHVNVNFVDKISVFQQFALVNDSIWMMSKDKIVIRFKVTENMLGIIGRKTTSYKDYRINRPDIDKFFEARTDIVVDEKAFEKTDSFWTANRHEDLTLNESGVYEMVDSLKKTKAFRTWVDVFNMIVTGYYPVDKFEFGPIASVFSVNDVERFRFRLGIRTTEEMSERVRLGVFGAYGMDDRRFKYGGDILVLIDKDPRQSLGAEYIHDLDLRPANPAQFGQENILTGLIRRNVPQKLNLITQTSVFYEKEWKVGYSNRLTLRHREITPQFPFYYLQETANSHSDTIESFITSEIIFKLRFAYHEKFLTGDFNRVSLGTRYPTLVAWYTLGLKDILGSDFQYHKIEVALNDRIPVNPIGTFHFTLTAGKTFGTLPYLLLNVAPGNETFFYNRFAFNMMNNYEFITDQYVSLNIRHHFEGFFLNKIPGFRKLKLREVLFANLLIGTMTEANKSANPRDSSRSYPPYLIPFPKPYAELGFGIENILKLFEVDILWRLTYRDVPLAPKWGPTFGMKIDF
ncbi:MAG TPA: DUF5686 family protein [Chitinophagales bacterium]|nr:DUF5686 family protein [Chitinophagales bacterium]